jgi:hypothetical protein
MFGRKKKQAEKVSTMARHMSCFMPVSHDNLMRYFREHGFTHNVKEVRKIYEAAKRKTVIWNEDGMTMESV